MTTDQTPRLCRCGCGRAVTGGRGLNEKVWFEQACYARDRRARQLAADQQREDQLDAELAGIEDAMRSPETRQEAIERVRALRAGLRVK